MNALLLAALLGASPFVIPAPYSGGPVSGQGDLWMPTQTTDSASRAMSIRAGGAYSQAATNTTGAPLVLSGGPGKKFYTAVSNVAGAVVTTLTVTNGDGVVSSVALTSGVSFNLGANDTAPELAVTATNLAAAINGNATLGAALTATASTVYVYLQPKDPVVAFTIASDQAARISATSAADGQIMSAAYGTATSPSFSWPGDPDTGMYHGSGANELYLTTGGVNAISLSVYGGSATFFRPISMNANRIYDGGAALNLGATATTGHSLATGAVIIGKDAGNLSLEVDGSTFFDASTTHGDNVSALFGSSFDARISYATAQTPDALYIGTSTDSNLVLIAEVGDNGTDFAKALQTNPTLCLQSADQATTTDRLCLAHDQTNGVISTDGGILDLQPAAKGVKLPVLSAASVAEPVACAAGTAGTMVYVNDSDDGAAAELCICAGITNDATFDWVQVKDMTTACSFF